MPRLSLDRIQALSEASLAAAGARPLQAEPVARSIRQAEADDMRTIGIGYLPTYLGHLKTGKVDGQARPTVSRPASSVVRVDAAHGFAHAAFEAGLPVLAEATRSSGTASLAIARSYSAGILGHWVERVAEEGLVALAFANAPPSIAPWGGFVPLFGTNPMAFAVPREGRAPMVLDQASSVVAKVNLFKAAREGSTIPAGWAIDRIGRPTSDPIEGLAGSMLPFGGAKGAGIALLVEVLAAGLTGANFSKDASPFAEPDGPPPGVGQFVVAFDPAAYDPNFGARMEDLFAAMLSQSGVRLPGDRRHAARERAMRDGVRVDPETLEGFGWKAEG